MKKLLLVFMLIVGVVGLSGCGAKKELSEENKQLLEQYGTYQTMDSPLLYDSSRNKVNLKEKQEIKIEEGQQGLYSLSFAVPEDAKVTLNGTPVTNKILMLNPGDKLNITITGGSTGFIMPVSDKPAPDTNKSIEERRQQLEQDNEKIKEINKELEDKLNKIQQNQ